MTPTAPAGWYHDGMALRWWDGAAWGPYTPVVAPDPVEAGKGPAVLSHFGWFACWFVIPLMIRLTAGRDNPYVRHHATEALNFMICASAVYLFGMVTWIFGITAMAATDSSWPAGFMVIWPLIAILQLGVLACSIVGAVRASQGVWWRYPISIRFVKP